MAKKKQTFAVGTSRAVARLSVLAELVLPYIKVGGTLVALKGASCNEELEEAKNSIVVLGGEVETNHMTELRFDDRIEARSIIVIQKIKTTPAQYPRQYAAILKKPL